MNDPNRGRIAAGSRPPRVLTREQAEAEGIFVPLGQAPGDLLKPAPFNGRFVVNETVGHIPVKGATVTLETHITRGLITNEQPYLRRCKVSTSWQPVDTGWIKEAAVLVLRNDEGQEARQLQPDREERLAVARRVVELGLVGSSTGVVIPFAEIRPGESARISPVFLSHIYWHCREDEAQVSLLLIPRDV
jgi:hypothetical protein